MSDNAYRDRWTLDAGIAVQVLRARAGEGRHPFVEDEEGRWWQRLGRWLSGR